MKLWIISIDHANSSLLLNFGHIETINSARHIFSLLDIHFVYIHIYKYRWKNYNTNIGMLHFVIEVLIFSNFYKIEFGIIYNNDILCKIINTLFVNSKIQ